MKRTKQIVKIIFMSIIMCFCLLASGCLDLLSSNTIEGTYKFKSMSYMESGVKVELVAGEKYMDMIELSEDFMTIVLNEDGTASMKMAEDPTDISVGAWQKDEGSNIALTFEGETLLCAHDGYTLTLEEDGITIVLQK